MTKIPIVQTCMAWHAGNSPYSRLGLVSTSKLNIRSQPSAISSTVSQPLTKGTKVEIVTETDDWYKMNLKVQGWVKKELNFGKFAKLLK